MFILDLLNPKLNGVWECFSFREFLSERYSQEELFFYLHSRFLLLQGKASERPGYQFDIIMYVRLEWAKQVVAKIMQNFDSINIQYAMKILTERSKKKNANRASIIDHGFVLQMLMQFFRIERYNRFKLLKEGFQVIQTIGGNGKFVIEFNNFKKFIQMSYPRATQLDIAQLYRETYSTGQGQVNVENFFTVAQETGFFIRNLRLPSLLTIQPQMSESQTNIACELKPDPQRFEAFLSIFEDNKDYFLEAFQQIRMIGLESLSREIEEIQNQIQLRFTWDLSEISKGR